MAVFSVREVPARLPPTMDSGVYQIRNTENGRIYIGSAVRVGKRWREHLRGLRTGKHHSRFMQRCWDKHGEPAFEFSLLIACAPNDLVFYEQRALDVIKPQYNSAPTAGSQFGYRHTDQARQNMSIARRRNPSSPRKGMTHTEESKRKISESRKGKGGGPRSPERLAKISAALTGRSIPQVVRDKIAAKLRGHKQSKEQIARRVAKLRGRKMPDGFAEAAAARMRGKKLSAETVLKLSMSNSKLTDQQVRSVREMLSSGRTIRETAIILNIGKHTVGGISAGRGYGWVTE